MVYICTRQRDGKQLAVKVINSTDNQIEETKRLAKEEADFMREHNHEYLIRCVDFQVEKGVCYIFMELANEDLHTYI